jgi:hypothetical protein
MVLSAVGFWAIRDPQLIGLLALPAVSGLALAVATRAGRGLVWWLLPAIGAAAGALGAALAAALCATLSALSGRAGTRLSLDEICVLVALGAPWSGVLGLVLGLSLHSERKRIAAHGR